MLVYFTPVHKLVHHMGTVSQPTFSLCNIVFDSYFPTFQEKIQINLHEVRKCFHLNLITTREPAHLLKKSYVKRNSFAETDTELLDLSELGF